MKNKKEKTEIQEETTSKLGPLTLKYTKEEDILGSFNTVDELFEFLDKED